MKYMSRVHGESKVEELSKDRVRFLLEGCYTKESVDDIMYNCKNFHLRTPTRDIWTETKDGLVPMPGFYGICE